MTKEYLHLFKVITDAIQQLEDIKQDLIAAQRQAEELYIGRTE